MRKVKWDKETINLRSAESICVPIWIGSDDIFVQNAAEIVQQISKEPDYDMPYPTTVEAIGCYLRDISGNSFEILAVECGEIVELDRTPFFEGL